jgi:hypothetical protein
MEQRNGPATLVVRGDNPEAEGVEVRLSGTLEVRLCMEGKSTLEVELPKALVPPENWLVKEAGNPETRPIGSGRIAWERSFRIEPILRPGNVTLPIAPLRYRDGSEAPWQTVEWQPVPVRVTTMVAEPNPSELRPITPLEEVPTEPSWKDWVIEKKWHLAVAGVIVLCVVLGIRGTLHQLRRPPPPVPPHVWALAQLEQLNAAALTEESEPERLPTLVSDVVRRYLELRINLKAQQQTTAEFLDSLRAEPRLPLDQVNQLAQFLERCDLAKFARAIPNPEECRELIGKARELVEHTAPEPEAYAKKPATASEPEA